MLSKQRKMCGENLENFVLKWISSQFHHSEWDLSMYLNPQILFQFLTLEFGGI